MLMGDIPLHPLVLPSTRGIGDARFDSILLRALAPKPEDRYPSAAEMMQDLDAPQAPNRRIWLAILMGFLVLTGLLLLRTI
jgi:hypothetical protein